MKGLKSLRLFNKVTLLFSAVYLFYALTNVYFLHRSLTFSSATSAFSGVRSRGNSIDINQRSINFTRLGDKCFLEENQLELMKCIAVLVVTFFGFISFRFRQTVSTLYVRLIYNKQYSYLSLRTFRI
jgi:hypothetical protein